MILSVAILAQAVQHLLRHDAGAYSSTDSRTNSRTAMSGKGGPYNGMGSSMTGAEMSRMTIEAQGELIDKLTGEMATAKAATAAAEAATAAANAEMAEAWAAGATLAKNTAVVVAAAKASAMARVSAAEAATAAAETRASEAEAALTAEAAKAREWKRLYDELTDAVMTQRIAERRAA
jgi:hypothetical protein